MSDFVCSVVPLSRGPTIQHILAKQYAQRADLPSDISMVPISTTFPPPGVVTSDVMVWWWLSSHPLGRSTEKGQNPVPSAICGEGLEKSKQHHKKPPPRYLGPGKSNGRPDSQTLELAGGRIIMHAIYRGQSRRVNERAWVGGTGHRNCGTQRERELSVVLNRFQNLLLKSIISRGWCMCEQG